MNYKVTAVPINKIIRFYQNVAKKYRHTYSKELMAQNINDAIDSMYKIENSLQRRKPTISRWKNYFMANTNKWYYAYMINNNTITVIDACHSQNMKESFVQLQKIILKESQLRRIIQESIKKVLNII